MPFISICIPAYKREKKLTRLLDSIENQSFQDIEIIISDDSPDDGIERMLAARKNNPKVKYTRNFPALGTPANWNNAIRQASGQWIKLMHDDDWFASSTALSAFAAAADNGNAFIFSAYRNVADDGVKPPERKTVTGTWKKRILKEPMTLLAYNIVGPPSVTMFPREILEAYDERLKWRVDMEFYARLLYKKPAISYIPDILVNVGINSMQVTNACLYNPAVEIPEGKILLDKYGDLPLRNIWVYDAWWRLLRNMNIFHTPQLEQFGDKGWSPVITGLVRSLSQVPSAFLAIGPFSKMLMLLSYIKNRPLANK